MKKKLKSGRNHASGLPAAGAIIIAAALFLKFAVFDERYLFYQHIMSIAVSGALLLFASACAFGAGDILLAPLKKKFHSKTEQFVIQAAAGFGALSFLVFVAGALGALAPLTAALILAAVFLVSSGRIVKFFRRAGSPAGQKNYPLSPFETAVISITAVSALIYYLKCFVPPLNYDTLAYHLAVPKAYIDAGGIRFIPENIYSNFPMNMEFLFLLGLLLRDDSFARLFHFAAGLLSATAIYSFASKHYTRKAAITGAAAFLNIPYVGLLSGWAFNELLLSLYILLSLFCFSEWWKNRKTEDLILSTVFCGLAVGTKYTALLFLLPFLAVGTFTAQSAAREAKKEIIKKTLLAAGIALLVPLPWFLKNAVYTGNPVFPFLHGFFLRLFPHPAAEAFDMARFVSQHTPSAITASSTISLIARTFMSLQIGPFFAVSAPFLFRPGMLKKFETKIMLAYFISYLVLWAFFSHRDPRFLVPALGIAAVPLAHAVTLAAEKSRNLKWLTHLLVIAVFLSNLAWIPFRMARQDMLKVIFGYYSREEFLQESGLYQYPAFSFINQELPGDAVILFIGENQIYYVNRKVISNSPLDTNIIVEIVNRSSTVEDIRKELKGMGVTHVLYNASEVRRTAEAYNAFRWASPAKERLFIRFIAEEKYLGEMFSERGVIIWELE